MKVEAGKFACDACGKGYAWKPQLAGKRAKCSCGATIVVPQADAPVDQADDLYDVVDTPPPQTTVTRPVTAAAPGASAVGYGTPSTTTAEPTSRDRFSAEAMTHPPRDLYIPTGLLVAGMIGIIAWTVTKGAETSDIPFVLTVVTVATLIKVGVLIGMAFLFAPMVGVSFGEARTAMLKFAAIIISTDACGMWFDDAVETMGGYPSGRAGRRVFWIQMFVIAAMISTMCYYLFDMDSEDAGTFAFPFAIASQVVGFILYLVLSAVLSGAADAEDVEKTTAARPSKTSPAKVAPSGGGGSTPAPAAVAPPAPAEPGVEPRVTERDREIERMIGTGTRLLQDANEYNQSQPQKSKIEPELVNQFYGAGAKRVYFGGKTIIVQLPDAARARAQCFAAADAYRAANNLTGPGPSEQGQRYLEMELVPAPSRGR